MKKNGFSIVEMLVALMIVALLVIFLLPLYITLSNRIKNNLYSDLVLQLETESHRYAKKEMDSIKKDGCKDYTISDLIDYGMIRSDLIEKNAKLSPLDGTVLRGVVRVCYCPSKSDIVSYYVEEYNAAKTYRKGDKVTYNDKIYICIRDANVDSINNPEFFNVVEC